MEIDQLQIELKRLSASNPNDAKILQDIEKDLHYIRNLLRCSLSNNDDDALVPPPSWEPLEINKDVMRHGQESLKGPHFKWPSKNANRDFRNVPLYI